MKKFIPTIGLLASLLTAQAQNYFTPGNLAVVRIGGPNPNGNGEYVTSGDNGNTVYIDEYTTSGTLVQSLPVPSSGPNALILSAATYEGLMTIMPDQSRLVLIGYNTPYPYSSQLTYSTNTVVPRIVATVDAYGNFAYPITNTSIFDVSYVPTCAASDGTNYWAIGTGPSTGYNQVAYLGTATAGTTAYIINNIFSSGGRSINIYDVAGSYEMFLTGYPSNSAALSGGYLVSNASGTLPTALTGATNIFPTGTEAASTPSDFVINSAGTIAYVIDQGSGGLVKFTNNGSGWHSNYTIILTNTGFQSASGSQKGLSVAADFTQTPPVLYAVTAETYTNRLVSVQDNGPGSTVINLAKNVFNPTGANSGTNTFRGVRFVPLPVPVITVEPASFVGNPGDTATFSTAVIGVPAPACQWYSNSVANPTYVAIPGATNSILSLANINNGQNGSLFYMTAVNTYGTAQSAIISLTVQNPAIVTEPTGATNLPGGGPVSLCVTAVGTGALSYQWLSNGVPISGAHSSCYTVPSSEVSETASYSVIITNTAGASVTSITSSPVIVSYSLYLINDTFSYPNGNLFGDAGSPWTDINGSNPEIVTNGRVQINQTNATTDAQELFSQPEGNTVIWASFVVNFSALPTNPGGVYFANLEDTNFNFFGRIFALTSNQPGLTPDIPNVAYPGTYRLGIADAQNDSANTGSTGPNAVVPVDLAPGIDYQVVYYVDFGAQVSGMAINPASVDDVQADGPGGVSSGTATDTFDPSSGGTRYTNQLMNAFGLRQRQGEGVLVMDNLQVSYDWSDYGSGYTVVTAGVTATNPVIGLQPAGTTNYKANPIVLEVAASGIGAPGAGLTYAWYQNGNPLSDGTNVTGSATPTLSINSLVATNSGTYYVTVQGAVGSPVQSSNAVVSVITTATPPMFTVQPAANTTNSEGGNVILTSLAVGTGPITYAWYFNNGSGTSQVGSSENLTLSNLGTNQSGTYYVIATGNNGALQTRSSNAVLVVNGPQSVTIGYLRSLLNPTTYQPSDTTTLYNITGVVTTATNLTSGNTSSCYIQDSTGGLNLFVTDGSDFRPQLGDLVTATGVLSSYVDNFELDVIEGSGYYVNTILSHSNSLPSPIVLPWGYTAPLPANIAANVEGSVVMLTNLYFQAYAPGAVFASGTQYVVKNNAGLTYTLFVSDQDTNLVTGQPIPEFASSVSGPLVQDNTTVGLEFTVYSNLVISAPAPVTITNLAGAISSGKTNFTLTWTAVPNTASYSVLYSSSLAGPFTNVLATGLAFTSTLGTYTDTLRTNSANFYVVSSP